MNLGDDPDLYQLYGNMGNVRVVPIRNICRQRIEGHSPWFTNQTLKDHADDAQELAATIEAKGGAIGAMKQCEHIEDVLRYWAEDPQTLHEIIMDKYHDLHHDAQAGDTECPFEERSNKKACWSCHLPREVWSAMEDTYNSQVSD